MELKNKKTKKQKELEKKNSVLLDDLASLENYITELFAFLPVPVCFISPIGVVLEFNPAFERISGYKFYEVLGEGAEKLFKKKNIEELIRETLKNEGIENKEIILLPKNKKEIPVSAFTRARRDKNKSVIGLFICIFNLSEIKNDERQLREKMEELKNFQKLAVGRELKMVELKKELKKLKES